MLTLPRLRWKRSPPGFGGKTTFCRACRGSGGTMSGGRISSLACLPGCSQELDFSSTAIFHKEKQSRGREGALLWSWVQPCDVISFTSSLQLCSLEVFYLPETRENQILLGDLGLADLEDQGPSSKFNYLQVFHTSMRGWKIWMGRRKYTGDCWGTHALTRHIVDAPIGETKAGTRRAKGKCFTL